MFVADPPFIWTHGTTYVDHNNNYTIEFTSSRGYSFRQGYVDTVLEPHIFKGFVDITDSIDEEYWYWTRESEDGKTEADITWDRLHQGTKTLHLTNAEMPAGWSTKNKAIFTCYVILGDGEDATIVNNQIIS